MSNCFCIKFHILLSLSQFKRFIKLQKKNTKMDFKLNFEKPEISKKVIKFLEENLPNEEDKTSIRRIGNKYKLNYMDANALIQAILQALIMEDGEEEFPISQDILEDKSLEETVSPTPGSSGLQNKILLLLLLLLLTKIKPAIVVQWSRAVFLNLKGFQSH